MMKGDFMLPEKDFNLVVGLRIREVREGLEMTRAQFSEKCDISDSFLAAVESGKKSITSKTLFKICSSFDISADYFIRGYDESFETDAVIELIRSMNKEEKASACKIMRAYIQAIRS